MNRNPRPRPCRARLLAVLLGLALIPTSCGAGEGLEIDRVLSSVPSSASPGQAYVIYLHGRIVETEGIRPTHPRFGVYEYESILRALAERGVVVISEVRPPDTNASVYADKVLEQIESLIAAGATAQRITVVGFSKGGAIAAMAASRLQTPGVGFALTATCGPWMERDGGIELRGHMLSIYEASDELAGSCKQVFARSPRLEGWAEIEIDLGGGHGAFYRPHADWVDPLVTWATRNLQTSARRELGVRPSMPG